MGIDLLLACSLAWLAFRMVLIDEVFDVVIYFIVFGMILSLVWVRLGAYDLALAEAALGAGITGALLLDTLAFLKLQKGEK